MAPRGPAFAFSVLLFATAAVRAATYPGPAPCDTTLQACIAAAVSGAIVAIATNGPIAENPSGWALSQRV